MSPWVSVLNNSIDSCLVKERSLRSFPVRNFRKGSALPGSSRQTLEIRIICSGFAKRVHVSGEGKEVILGLYSRGTPVGASEAVVGSRDLSVRMLVLTTCSALCIPAGWFVSRIRENGPLSWSLHRLNCAHVLQEQARLATLASSDARARLIELRKIITEGDALNRRRAFGFPRASQEMAQLLSATPSHLSRLIVRLERDGILTEARPRIFHSAAGTGENGGNTMICKAEKFNPSS
jgi:CRP-like cAMP-binding protein